MTCKPCRLAGSREEVWLILSMTSCARVRRPSMAIYVNPAGCWLTAPHGNRSFGRTNIKVEGNDHEVEDPRHHRDRRRAGNQRVRLR